MARGGRKGRRGRGARAGGKREEGLRGVPGGAAAKKRLVNVHWILGWGKRAARGESCAGMGAGKSGEGTGSGRKSRVGGGITRRESAGCGGENKRGGGSRRSERGGRRKKAAAKAARQPWGNGAGDERRGGIRKTDAAEDSGSGGDATDDVAPVKRKRKDTAGAKAASGEETRRQRAFADFRKGPEPGAFRLSAGKGRFRKTVF